MTSMTDNETYNGWKNRETWAFNLHWQNDQGLYVETLQYATGLVTNEDESPREVTDREIGESVVAFWCEQLAELEAEGAYLPATGQESLDALRMMRNEVGSWWRIDYAEVGAAVRESLDNES